MSSARAKRKSPGTLPFDRDAPAGAGDYDDDSHSAKKRRDVSTYVENPISTPPRLKKNTRSRAVAAPSNLYDEADGDFVFTRGPGKAKRASTAGTGGAAVGKPSASAVDSSMTAQPRQNPSAARAPRSPHTAPKPTRSKQTASSSRGSDAHHSVRRSPRLQPGSTTPSADLSGNLTTFKVSLAAVEETPVVRKKKKEIRDAAANGQRRSSIGLRGRRASSLSNGCVATPHPEVDYKDFYKHLDVSSTELIRMQHLLAWCSRRAIPEDALRKADAPARAARVVNEDILQHINEQKMQINWWSREDGKEKEAEADKQPNPRNEENLAKIKRFEEQYKKLLEEKNEWEESLRMSKAAGVKGSGQFKHSICNVERLPSVEKYTLPDTSHSVASSLREVLGKTQRSIEFNVDLVEHGVHKVVQFGQASRKIGEKFLAETASFLGRQEELTLKEAGTLNLPMQEVLIALAQMER